MKKRFLSLGLSLIASSAFADLYWDTNGASAGLGGTGSWDLATTNWNDATGTGIPTTWVNSDNAIFNGTAGTVTLATTGLTANGLTFGVTGYTLAGTSTNPLTLSGPAIIDTNGTGSSGLTLVTGTLAGTNLVKTGLGTLEVRTATALSGGTVTVNGGVLRLGDATSTSSNPSLFLSQSSAASGTPEALVLNNGTLSIAASSSGNSSLRLASFTSTGISSIELDRTAASAGVSMSATLTSSGTVGTFTATNGTPLTISGQLTITGAGNLGATTPSVLFGATTFTGDTTFVSTANTTFTTNVQLGGNTGISSGAITDMGHSMTLLGGGSATQAGGLVRLNGVGSVLTGALTIGNAGGTSGGAVQINLNTSNLTTGPITVNPYSALLLNVAGATPSYGSLSQTITLNGIGNVIDSAPALAGALRFSSITASSVSTLASNVILSTDSTIGVGTTGTTGVLSGVVSGAGKLTVNAPTGAKLQLTNANTYLGGTVVSGGTLLVTNTTGSALGVGAVTVGTAATLGGTGIISAPVSIGGTLSPGIGAGLLTINGNVTFTTGGIFAVELGGTAVGTQYDQLSMAGALDLGSSATLSLSLINGFVPADGTVFTIATGFVGGPTGTFSGLADGAVFTTGGSGFKINYNSGNITLTATAVPEPSTVALVGFGLGAILFGFRRKRA